MAITNTDEFLDYSSFNSTGGVTTSDTFNTWRKKTNGIINAIDSISIQNIIPSQLSLGAPIWNTSGALSTYNLGPFTAGTINGTTITGTTITGTTINGTTSINGGTVTGTSLKVGSGGSAAATGSIHAITLGIGLANNEFTVSSTGAVTGASLKVGGSAAAIAGGINSLSLAVGTNNTQFTVSDAGAIVGSSLNVGSGAITAGAIVGSSLNVGSGAITAASFNGSLNGNALSATTATTAQTISNSSVTAAKLNGGQTGAAPIYGARAWADFGTTGGLRGTGGNIASVINTASGRYSVTFTTDMPNVNYAAIVTPGGFVGNEGVYLTSTTSKTRSGFDFVVARATDGSSSGDLVNMASPGNLVVFG